MNWIWKEARSLAERTQHKETVIFECGYGPSGLPHLGTFAEVARTDMVRRAFEHITGKNTRLIVFSDDMDALRKVPDNVPQQDMLENYIGMSLHQVPDPHGLYSSFADHNNNMLQQFLDSYEFDYEFMRSRDLYAGLINPETFNDVVDCIMNNQNDITEVVTKNYSQERKDTYCPVIPINNNQHVFKITDYEYSNGILYFNSGITCNLLSHERNFKFQWKIDWPMRWLVLGVDYEMHGKDLIDSAKIGQRICQILNRQSPQLFMYELFLDKNGRKISKSEGNGLEFGEWVDYAPADSLRWFLFQNPRKARRLYLDMVPQTVDSYNKELAKFHYVDNFTDTAVWAIHGNNPPNPSPVSYSMLLNLVNVASTDDPNILWRYIQNYDENANANDHPLLDQMVNGAVRFYQDRIAPYKEYRSPTNYEISVLHALADGIENYVNQSSLTGNELAEAIMQDVVYEIGKLYYGEDKNALREQFFKMLYQVLLGQDSGPRFGQFTVLYGIQNTINLIKNV